MYQVYEKIGSYSMETQANPGTMQTSKNTKPFDLCYGFYVTMGGFLVDVDKLHNKLSRVTLTSRGVIALAKRNRFLDISPKTVSDKSKANIITKALICIQVFWMVVQCISRKAFGYPLTLFEIHTMVHVVCALTLYSMVESMYPSLFYIVVINDCAETTGRQ